MRSITLPKPITIIISKECDKCVWIKALLWEGDGFLLMYKRLDKGSFRWPRSAGEAMTITEDQYRMLMQGLEIIAKNPITEVSRLPDLM